MAQRLAGRVSARRLTAHYRNSAHIGLRALLAFVLCVTVFSTPAYSPNALADSGVAYGAFTSLSVEQQAECPNWNSYKYGLDSLNPYMAAVGSDAIRSQYRTKKVLYVCGALDTEADESVDTVPAAMWQGDNRLQRMDIFMRHLDYHYGVADHSGHATAVVEGIGHSASKVLASDEVAGFLFDEPVTPNALAGGEGQSVSPEGLGLSSVEADEFIADRFSRTVSGGWGTADKGGTWSTIAGPTSGFGVDGSRATMDLGTVNSQTVIGLQSGAAEELDARIKIRVPAVPTGAGLIVVPVLRYVDASNLLGVRLNVTTSGNMNLLGHQRINGTNGTYGPTVSVGTLDTSREYWLRTTVQGIGPSYVKAKLWEAGTSEPGQWQFEANNTNAEVQVAGSFAVRAVLNTGNTNALPYRVYFDDLTVLGDPALYPTALSQNEFPISSGSDTLHLRYSSNAPIDAGSQDTAIIVIHGSSRNAPDYLSYARALLAKVSKDALIVAPQFLSSEDLSTFGIGQTEALYWNSSWREGNRSSVTPYNRPYQVSSFEAVDLLVDELAENLPNLKKVIVMGFSAGGQFVQRYAMGTTRDTAHNGLDFSYVVGAPSSYAYLDAQRLMASDTTNPPVDEPNIPPVVVDDDVPPPTNTAPSAVNDSYSTAKGTALVVAAPGVLANDYDADGDAIVAVRVSAPAYGKLTFNTNGSFTYKPAPAFSGLDSFTYRVSDGSANSRVATVSILVYVKDQKPRLVNRVRF